MPHLIATATTHPATPTATFPTLAAGVGWFLLAAALAALIYAAMCAVAPFGPCPRCAPGKGRKRKAAHCRHCDGTGLRLRTGRRLFNYLRRTFAR
ncbi:hypothetical protein [Bailinhaonella thermotolerans]|uniref:Uncharacterized protein n=1 Tax=Bailinhaonella thermotolerans TaxID=1070861 RepID=A0A3A4AM01_9ACTN|nr:hypothetical protein [Bailinhaonella thermotolerans]RJL29951.1 hypothetical protein D5H75_23650 [Bailinhaonella thermotolerans]